jgi:hypothetical protein
MKKYDKQRLFEMMGNLNEDFKSSSDVFREINQEKNANRETNKYTPEEWNEIKKIEDELIKLGLVNDKDYKLELPQDQMGTKIPRFEFRFFNNDIDSLLAKTNLDVYNPQVGSQVHGYVLRKLKLK